MSKLILGTVQFGLDYGISNLEGKPSAKDVHAILHQAYKGGITQLDTAEAYGNSELLIGEFLKKEPEASFDITTKFHFSSQTDVKSKMHSALERLSVNKIGAMMFHSYQDYKNNPGLLDELKDFKAQGLLGHIGVSVYTNDEIESLLSVEEVTQLQVPFNMLDNEQQRGALLKEAKSRGKLVHTRSTFLQGLFFMSLNDVPEHLADLKSHLEKLKFLCKENSLTMADLALSYVSQKPYIDGVLIGINSIEQLQENLKVAIRKLPKSLEDQIDSLLIENTDLLNPAKWKK